MQVLSCKRVQSHLSYKHTRTLPNENIQEVWLAHLWIDEVLSYCLRINQACVFNYDLMVSIVYTKNTVKKLDSDKSQ